MIKRTIEISGYDTFVSLKHKQVIVEKEGEKVGQIPAEDIGILIIDSPSATYTHSALIELMNQGAVVVLCGKNHYPDGMILSSCANCVQTARMAEQVSATLPTKKRIWQQLIKAKISNQSNNLEDQSLEREKMVYLSSKVRSGDPDNIEGQASRIYWKAWLGENSGFYRKRDGPPPNNLLNYGYMVIRAAIARAIVGAGFHPSIGLNHHNQYNQFCLADDLLEPFRPFIDRNVRELYQKGYKEINKETKTALLSLILHPVEIKGFKGPLMVELERMLASLERCYSGKERDLEIPEL